MQIYRVSFWPALVNTELKKKPQQANIFILTIVLQQKLHWDIHVCMTYILKDITTQLSILLVRWILIKPHPYCINRHFFKGFQEHILHFCFAEQKQEQNTKQVVTG